MNCFYSSSGNPANKPYADSMPVHRLRRRSGTKSALPMPIRRVYWTAAHIIMVLPSKHEMPTQHRADVTCLPDRRINVLSAQGTLPGAALYNRYEGRGPRVVVSTAAFHARARGSVPGLGGLKETKMFLFHPRVKVSIVGSLRDREIACSA